MLITKFNRLIRSKIVWGGFAFVVVISFVGFFTPGSRRAAREAGEERLAGKLNGQPVTQEELRDARFNTFLSLCLSVGRAVNLTADMEKAMRKQSWQRLAALRVARNMGIVITDREVVSAIQRDPMFAVDGRFSRAQYDSFVRGFLANLGATAQHLEEFMREQLVLQKLQTLISSAVWVPPAELQDALHMYADTFTVQYLTLDLDRMTKHVQASNEEARAFFEAHTNMFVIPERVSVKYVSYPLTDFTAGIDITAAAVSNYYTEHLDRYTTRDTNDNFVYTDLAQVEPDIRTTLLMDAARDRAKEKAAEFVDLLTPDRDGSAPAFEKAAADLNLTVSTSALFSVHETLEGLGVDLDFNRTAFELRPTAEEYYSDAISGHSNIYVIAFNSREEARLPGFEEVAEKAVQYATERARRQALTKKASEIRDSLRKALDEGQTFDAAARTLGLEVKKTPAFTAFEAPPELESGEMLSQILSRKQGEITEPLWMADGVLLAWVAERKAADEAGLNAIRGQLLSNLNRRRSRVLFGEWQESLIQGDRLQDLQPEPVYAEEEEAEEAEGLPAVTNAADVAPATGDVESPGPVAGAEGSPSSTNSATAAPQG
jgi:peptidyl-prolyl cis-trans isomerase D